MHLINQPGAVARWEKKGIKMESLKAGPYRQQCAIAITMAQIEDWSAEFLQQDAGIFAADHADVAEQAMQFAADKIVNAISISAHASEIEDMKSEIERLKAENVDLRKAIELGRGLNKLVSHEVDLMRQDRA